MQLNGSLVGSKRIRIIFSNQDQLEFGPEKEILIGRADLKKGIIPDLDLSPYLKNPLHISRQQANLFYNQDSWFLKLNPNSSSLVFLDGQVLSKTGVYQVPENAEIAFGAEPNCPEVIVKISVYS